MNQSTAVPAAVTPKGGLALGFEQRQAHKKMLIDSTKSHPAGQIVRKKKMRGNIKNQTKYLLFESGIFRPGEPKHEAKDKAREALKEEGKSATWKNIGAKIGIYSYKTANDYREVWQEIGQWAKETHKVRDLEKLTGRHVSEWLTEKAQQLVAWRTLQHSSAALAKMELALNQYSEKMGKGIKYNFRDAADKVKAEYKEVLKADDKLRAYKNPEQLKQNVWSERYQVAAALQHEGGLRVREAALIKPDQVKGNKITVKGKGGKIRAVAVSQKTSERLRAWMDQNGGIYKIKDVNKYREALKEAAWESEQEYQGSHGLRWNYAQQRMKDLQSAGQTYEKAMVQVSQELGHERASITEHYLR